MIKGKEGAKLSPKGFAAEAMDTMLGLVCKLWGGLEMFQPLVEPMTDKEKAAITEQMLKLRPRAAKAMGIKPVEEVGK